MTPKEFLSAVLPREGSGYYCIAELTTPKKQHVFVDTLEAAFEAAASFSAKNYDVYFATSTFAEKGSREAKNAQATRSLFIDIDCGPNKAYATKEAATSALSTLCNTTKLPPPIVVSSGNGVHAYWPFKDEISPREAATLASVFKSVVVGVGTGPVPNLVSEQHNDGSGSGSIPEPTVRQPKLAIDATVTGDASRVLRVPGTNNWKDRGNPKPVEILSIGETVEFNAILETLRGLLPEKERGVDELFAHIAAPASNVPASMVQLVQRANSEVKFSSLVKLGEAGCGQVNHYLANASDDGMEPLWRGLLSLAKYCVDADTAAVKLSALHPYSSERTEQKLAEIKGPYPCHKFNSENPGICGKCPHFAKIKNPLALVREVKTETEEKVISFVEEATAATDTPVVQEILRHPAPTGFEFGAEGGIYEAKEVTEGGVRRFTKTIVLPYDFFLLGILNNERTHTVYFTCSRGGLLNTVTVPQKSVVSRDETIKALADQNIVAANSQDAALHRYIRGCVEYASFNREAIKVPSRCGWQDDDSFVFDGRVFTAKEEARFPMPGLENVFKASTPTGSLDKWRDIINMFTRREDHEILAMSLIGFGAPLMRFTGLYGMTFHLGSTESGTGKTLAIELAASVWGDPVKSRTTVDTSSIATLNRLGLLGTLPLCTDEITAKNRSDFEWLPGFLFSVTEGHGKERMESGANRERINTTYWQSLVLLSSNTHVMDYLTGARKHSSEGEIRRVLELKLNKQMQLSPEEVATIKSLRYNFATAGERYARWLVKNKDKAREVVQQIYDALYTDFKATNDERFWMSGIAAAVAGGVLAGKDYADVVNYPMKSIVGVFKKMVEEARLMTRESMRNAEDVLNSFIREFFGKFVVVRKLGNNVNASFANGNDIDQSLTRTEVCGRVEHLANGTTSLFVEETLLKSYCASMSFGYSDFRAKLARDNVVRSVSKDLLSGTRGPTMRVKALEIIRPVNHEAADFLSLAKNGSGG